MIRHLFLALAAVLGFGAAYYAALAIAALLLGGLVLGPGLYGGMIGEWGIKALFLFVVAAISYAISRIVRGLREVTT